MTTYVRVPPDSTGKKIGATERSILRFDTQTGLLREGSVITGLTSGANGTIAGVDTFNYAANTGVITLKNDSGTFLDNEELQISGITVATADLQVTPFETIYSQQTIVTDPNYPEYHQRVNQYGSAFVTFRNGAPNYSPFGELLIGQQRSIKDYRFAYDEMPDDFGDVETGGGSVSYEANNNTILFSTGTASGDVAQRTSHFYHPYAPGVGSIVEMTIAIGDTGKANVRRRWGLFDDDNGVFFELDGTTLYCVVRSNTTGTPDDVRVAQTDFSYDQLNGSDASAFSLDLTKGNIYWIDFQWLGAGTVNFGVFGSDGQRLLAHVVENANIENLPYMATATLPIRIEQENTGTAGSGSEIRLCCATVKRTSEKAQAHKHFSRDSNTLVTIADTDGIVPLLSIRPKQLFNTKPNRGIISLESFDIISANSSGKPALISLVWEGTLVNSDWISHNTGSITEYDINATSVSTGTIIKSWLVEPGRVQSIDLVHDIGTWELYLNADGTTQKNLTLTVKVLSTGSSDFMTVFNWNESAM